MKYIGWALLALLLVWLVFHLLIRLIPASNAMRDEALEACCDDPEALALVQKTLDRKHVSVYAIGTAQMQAMSFLLEKLKVETELLNVLRKP